MEKMNVLYLERMGCEFPKNPTALDEVKMCELSDIGNYRLNTPGETIPGKNGKMYALEFKHGKKYAYGKSYKSRKVENYNELWIDTEYTDADGMSWRDLELEKLIHELGYNYTTADILAAVNSFSAVQYDKIEYVWTFTFGVEPGENFTPATLIHNYCKGSRIPEKTDGFGKAYIEIGDRGKYTYHHYEIKHGKNRDFVTVWLIRMED